MKKILLFVLLLGATIGANAQLFGRTKTINVIPDNAKIFHKGAEVGQGSYTFQMGREDYMLFKLKAPGYIDKTIKVYKANKQNTFTYQLEVDEAYANSEASSDLANKSMTIVVREGMSLDEVWKRLVLYLTDVFPDMEIMDKSAGWLRSAWMKQDFAYATIRTRIEVKEMIGQDDLRYRVKLQSEYAWHDCGGGDECYQQWDRVLKTYNQAIQDLFNAIR